MEPDFGTFYRALYRGDGAERRAFRWQERLANELVDGKWWSSLTAPTGTGKTTFAEAWLYALARSGPDRLGRRLFWVVDRRAVVDQVHTHMTGVVERLLASEADEVRWVAERLETAVGGGSPPVALIWRGGLDEVTSAHMRADLDPAAVALISSTVDQVGSRLLFRGYGLGTGSRALHAGLVGIDSTIVLDEAHIARPFEMTLEGVRGLQAQGQAPRPPLRHISVTATPNADGGFALREEELAEDEVAKRVGARKLLELGSRASKPEAVAKLARSLASADELDGPIVGVVLNTVHEARAAFEELGEIGVGAEDRALIVGPVRPLDRAGLLDSIPDRRDRVERAHPFFVVATQTIEVGVDLDFDAMITAAAPVPALVQRLGRLDRRGDRGTTRAVVLPPPQGGCPVYGEDAATAWDWLSERVAADGKLDAGPRAITELTAHAPPPAPDRGLEDEAPVLLDSHLGALTCIDALEAEIPEVDLFLHGKRQISSDVSLIWRSDLSGDSGDDEVAELLSIRPPHSGEALTLSLGAVRRWLRGAAAAPLADLPLAVDDRDLGSDRSQIAAWRVTRVGFATFEANRLRTGASLKPGDLIAVAAASGGADSFGWAPTSISPVEPDFGSLHPKSPRIVLRAREESGGTAIRNLIDGLANGTIDGRDALEAARAIAVDSLPSPDRPSDALREALTAAREQLSAGRLEQIDEQRLLVVGRAREGGKSSLGAAPVVPLAEHQRQVRKKVQRAAKALAIDIELRSSLERAAACHDEGKRDPRFQEWLAGGEAVEQDLAKSTYFASQSRRTAMRETAGWPKGKRHESLAARALIEVDPEDRLAAWSVLAHHGRIRPFPPSVPDPDGGALKVPVQIGDRRLALPGDSEVDLAWILETFASLSRRFGYWGLAYLEAVLMTADRGASKEVENER